MKQPTTVYVSDDLDRVIGRDFGSFHQKEIFSILDLYGTEERHLEVLRVQMACLKFSEG